MTDQTPPVQSQSKQGRKGWVLADREGLLHLPLRDNDEDAWWTPIVCGGGINLPGSQRRGTPTCPTCREFLAAEQGGGR